MVFKKSMKKSNIKRSAKKVHIKRNYRKKNTVAKMIKKILKPEIKQQSNFFVNDQSVLVGHPAPTSPALQFFVTSVGDVVNQIAQGTGQGDRIGNKILMKNMIVKGTVYTNTTTGPNGTPFGITGPIYVDVYIGYKRDLTPIESSLTAFFNDGDGWISPSGSSKDLLYPINRDKYVVLGKRRLKIGQNTYSTSTASYNDYSQHKEYKFNLSKFVNGKTCKWNDTINATPTSPLWNAISLWTVVINPATGTPFPSTYASTSTLGVYHNYVSTVYYTDD